MGFPFTSIDIRDLIDVHFQVVYVTATFPYLVLIIFFFRGITLHGFERGLEHLFVPEVKIKSSTNKWVECRTAKICCLREIDLRGHRVFQRNFIAITCNALVWYQNVFKTSFWYRHDHNSSSWILSWTNTIISVLSELEKYMFILNIELDLNLEFVLFLSSVEQVVWAGGMAGRRHTDILLLWPGFRLLDCTVIL